MKYYAIANVRRRASPKQAHDMENNAIMLEAYLTTYVAGCLQPAKLMWVSCAHSTAPIRAPLVQKCSAVMLISQERTILSS